MRIRIWDLPTRLFHWGLVAALVGSFGTARLDWLDMQWHMRFGYLALGLVIFRLIWGFAGPRHARFAQFLRGPTSVWAYLNGRGKQHAGHNPLGGWAVVLLLAAVLTQAITGLFNGDDIEWFGPLYEQASAATQKLAHRWHDRGFNLLLLLSGIHLAAIGWYRWRGQKLIGPMIHGHKEGDPDDASEPTSVRALVIAVAISVGVVWAVDYWGPR